ncbi:organic cation transporter protein-like isoform X2 [Panulirus ornatus]
MTAFHTLGGAFLAPRVNHTCLPPPSQHVNLTHDSCGYTVVGVDGSAEEEQPCSRWGYDDSVFSSTVTSEFALVCGREYLRTTYQSIYMFGIFVGAPLNGILADRFGRLPMVAISSVLYSVMAVGSCWLPSLPLLLVSRFLMGLMHPTSLQTGYILAMEVAVPKMRSALGVSLFLSWGLGTMAWGGVAYLIRDWRWLQLAVSLPCFLFLPTLWVMDESPRWLAVRGHHERALKVLERAAKWNKVSLPPVEEVFYILKNEQTELSQPKDEANHRNLKILLKSYLNQAVILFRTPRLRLITLVMYVDYLVVGMVYYGLSLSGNYFSTDPFVYMALTGLMEVPGNTLIIPVVTRCGRRSLNVLFFLFCGVVLLALPFINERTGWLMVTLAMVGKMIISSVFNILFLHASEAFPTEVRTRGMGTSLMMSRIGSMASPFVNDYLGPVYPWGPSIMFGSVSVVAGLATMALPETLGVALPDTIAKLENQVASHSKAGILMKGMDMDSPEDKGTRSNSPDV